MKRTTEWSYQWITVLVAGCYWVAVFLRSLIIYQDRPELGRLLALQLAFLILAISEPVLSRSWKGYFPIYVVLQTLLVFVLMATPAFSDFFATLLVIPSMQIMAHFGPKIGMSWIGLCTLTIALMLEKNYKAQGIALSLIFTAGNVFFGAYALMTQRAQAARKNNQALVEELREANQQLQAYSTQLEQLAVARERNLLARELHDSVTQTVFSMTLATQSALLLFERDPARVEPQLERLSQLAQSALSEMQELISELRPEKEIGGGLALTLRQHLEDRHMQESLLVSLEVEGDQPLSASEERNLFRIAREALNNIVKHARTSQAEIHLHLAEPFWMEIADLGQGFDLQKAQGTGRVGLLSMRERAAEIGWILQINTSPGAGTRIRVEKMPSGRRQA